MSAMRVYVGTTAGVYRLGADLGSAAALGLAPSRVWAIAAWAEPTGDVVLAGTYGEGMFRSEDGGATWAAANDGLTASHFRSIQPDPRSPGTVWAGAEPGRLFRSADGGRTWQEQTGFTDVPECAAWFLPYSPRAGAVRNVLLRDERPEQVLASVEVGGALASDDGGRSWRYLIGPDEDVHFITGVPGQPDRLYAAMGFAGRSVGTVLRSDDGGRRWRAILAGYTRAILVPPGEPNALLASPGPRVGRDAWLKLSRDGGETWTDVSNGVATPMPDQVEVFHCDPEGRVWGVCAGGRLLHADPANWQWRSCPDFEGELHAQSVAFAT